MISKCRNCNDEATLFCPLCQKVGYCSQKCRDYDWAVQHKNECKPEIPKKHVSDFEIVTTNSLGRGGFGCVKLVRDRSTGLLYAMKIIEKADISIENLKREVRIQKKLQHPHIIQLFDYFEDQSNVYLILEYAPNGSLFGYLRKKKILPENEAFVYFFQTCLGIDYLHKNQIIHRDLKPENLLLDKTGNIKICDFGWSAEMMQTQTRTTFCGTIDYMTPEMLEDRPHDYSLDLWCLGVLLYELLHGTAPFQGKNDYEKCQNIQKQEKFEFHTSDDAKDLILALMKRDPKKRLKMEDIFIHGWMERMAKTYDLNIQDYIFEFRQNKHKEMLSQSLKLDPKPTSSSLTTTMSLKQPKETIQMSIWSTYSDELQPIKPRVTKRTQARSEDGGFFSSLLVGCGCTKRK